jgi:Subtilase family
MSEQPNEPSAPQPAQPGPSSRRREPSLSPPPYVLNNHGGRVLDPVTAVRLRGQPPVRATVYVGARLLLRGAAVVNGDLPDDLKKAAEQAGLVATIEDRDRALLALADEAGVGSFARRTTVVRVNLDPAGDGPAVPPDSWQVIQNYRAIVGVDSQRSKQVSLDHLVTATADIEGVPFVSPHGVDGVPFVSPHGVGAPSSEFGVPGRGGRAPVAWQGPPPRRHKKTKCRRPVVAILDTGVGRHPWLTYPMVQRHPRVGSLPIGLTDPQTNAEATGRIDDPLEGTLDPDAGHGTFIAGLIHQTCPDADILSVRVMHGDGAVAEGDVLEALNRLLIRQAIALKHHRADHLIDVISLSLGYYHEFPSDAAFDLLILKPLRELGKLGVLVVASAGNDSTNRHMYPAGFAPHDGSQLPATHDALPVVSVGARNPDDNTLALFTNQANWVKCYRRGSNVVSTMPTTFTGALQPTARVRIGGYTRETLDPDNFSCGFGTWSGTSFSAPILAGEYAAHILRHGGLDTCDPVAAVERGWLALKTVAEMDRP